jgi:two-component system, OmpR family, response regulator CssR
VNKVYLVEDETALNSLLVTYLTEASYHVTSFTDGLQAKNHINDNPDLWVLDIMLPGEDGYSLIKRIKAVYPETPVIFMSARNAELDRVLGLEMGSDDYLPKPFLPRELVLRVNRLLHKKQAPTKVDSVIIEDYLFHRKKRVLEYKGDEISLSVKEFDVLDYLITNSGTAKSRSEILDDIWGQDYFGSDRVVDDTLRRIRKKCPVLHIENIYGYGYKLNLDSQK